MPQNTSDNFPLVLFSPGLTFSRHHYNALTRSIASEGLAVVTIITTRETVIVEHTDGTHVQGKFTHSLGSPEQRDLKSS